jgi:hypothetical protein
MVEEEKNLLDKITAQEFQADAVQGELEDYLKRLRAADQSGIAWVIIWAFVGAVAAIFVLVLGNLLFASECTPPANCDRWQDPAKFLLSIVSSILLPVVTLVLGYYFGKEKVV